MTSQQNNTSESWSEQFKQTLKREVSVELSDEVLNQLMEFMETQRPKVTDHARSNANVYIERDKLLDTLKLDDVIYGSLKRIIADHLFDLNREVFLETLKEAGITDILEWGSW